MVPSLEDLRAARKSHAPVTKIMLVLGCGHTPAGMDRSARGSSRDRGRQPPQVRGSTRVQGPPRALDCQHRQPRGLARFPPVTQRLAPHGTGLPGPAPGGCPAWLMTSVRTALEERRSCAVAATNSPVVLQEVPGRYVHVLTRYGSRTSVRGPTIETYGESAGLITSHVLGMDITQSNCAETRKELASRMSMEEIDALFGTGMSAQARALVMQMQHW